ncbi:CDP-glycerol:glycerophosphate glycerophosphotransferase [Mammaliicoccus sciuri]|uniref:bifunctional glycosyltransferase/CDP-glycerol:glycerophosphate glycerophosphotransferase n=1 Tax=Mammaliicoccus sciuri TaxID=1296 RepID=UPI00195500F5|nr:glycosyltransferase [Mammaliicoccus sciuri]MEB5676769.1 CDP-glycerol:glycerophosphate glycerophosphotransferase [Mammaliicoccus sciuri]
MKFEYDITVLVPVYNAESFLETTIESIINQKLDPNQTYEVLLINDGSTDNSEEICRKYSELYDNFSYYYHNNRGVSFTRNRGLDLANGKYILFLDADDLITDDTLKTVIKTFNKYQNSADILTYPLYRKIGNKLLPHVRNQVFNKKGEDNIYDIINHPFINQSTMNIAIKNLDENERIYFNEDLHYAEDAYFNTQMILRKNKVINTKNGGYHYNIGHSSAVDYYKSPVNIKDMLIDFFENLINTSLKRMDKVPQYVQGLILYELNWRLLQNTLFPYHLNEKDYQIWTNRMIEIFKHIEVRTIMQKPLMDYYHKLFFLKTFKNDIEYKNTSYNGVTFFSDGYKIGDYQNSTLIFNKIKFEDDSIRFIGFIKAPLLELMNDTELVISNKGKEINIPLNSSPAGYYKTRINIADFKGFDFKIPLSDEGEYEFKLRINKYTYKPLHWFDKNVIFKTHLGSKYVITNKNIIQYDSNPFRISILKRNKNKSLATNVLNHQNKLMFTKGQENLAKFDKVKKFIKPVMNKRKIWLYNDRIGVLDNAYYQFIHDLKKKDGVNRYYVIRKEDVGKKQFPSKNTVIYGSLKHKILYVYSDLILTSFKEFTEYSPLSYRANNLFYSDMKYKLVYLQHGVLNAHTPWLYGKHVTNFDKFVISSRFEKENLITNYGYNENDLIESGMPRLDEIQPKKKKKKILLAPSWRKSLINESTGLTRTIDEDNFIKSDFYNGINNIINSEKLNAILSENGYTLDVKLHPIFMEQSSLFRTEKSNINILKAHDDFDINDYELFITDFSSYMFDFIKSMTKIVFYMPDYDYFLSGNHIYNKLDFDVSKFSGLFTKSDDLIEYISNEIKNEFTINGSIYNLYNDFYFKHVGYKEHLYSSLKELN